jgi:magnesium-transporting ATPase (P-type)
MDYVFPEENPDSKGYALNGMASFYILLNSIVPLSMVITLEISKIYYTKMIEWDAELLHIDNKDGDLIETRV